MKVAYFDDTDTLYIELRAGEIAETRDLDESTLLDLDASGNICAMTFEHASERTDVARITQEGKRHRAKRRGTAQASAARLSGRWRSYPGEGQSGDTTFSTEKDISR